MRNPVWPSSCVTPAGTSNELDVQNEWEENTTHTLSIQRESGNGTKNTKKNTRVAIGAPGYRRTIERTAAALIAKQKKRNTRECRHVICRPNARRTQVRVCVCVFFPSILDIKFVGRTSRGHTGGRSHRIFNPPSFCGACRDFCREKDSAIPFPRRP